jgi:hypothetical protein
MAAAGARRERQRPGQAGQLNAGLSPAIAVHRGACMHTRETQEARQGSPESAYQAYRDTYRYGQGRP